MLRYVRIKVSRLLSSLFGLALLAIGASSPSQVSPVIDDLEAVSLGPLT